MRKGRRATGNGLWALLGLPLVLLLVVPLVAVVVNAAPAEVLRELRGEECWSAIGVSARTTSISLAVLLVFGTPLAYAFSGPYFPGRRVIDALVSLPAVLPPAVAGIALLLAFGRSGLFGPTLGRLGIQLPFTAGAVVFAQLFVSAPFFLRPMITHFRSIDPALAEGASLDGAGAIPIFSRLVLPMSVQALLGAASVAWARALGEFGATILFAGNRLGVTRTMPLAVYLGYETDLGQSVALSIILLVIALIVLVGGMWVARQEA
jgi:molybdate transport system permease protein